MTRAGSSRHRWVLLLVSLALAVLSVPSAGSGNAEPSGSVGSSTTPKFLKLTLDSVSPGTITTTSDSVLTLTGTVTNIGDRVVDDISVRVQRGSAISDPGELRSTLRQDQSDFPITGPFDDVTDELQPGQRKQFTLRIGVREGMDNLAADPPITASLGITDPGVYPLLLNVNGAPAYGSQAHLDDARFLLPVLGLPALPTNSDAAAEGSQPIPAAPQPPIPTTMVWPLADRPRLVAGVPGSVDGKALLTDDELAGELAAGGRLDQLLSALESALRPDPSRDSARSGPGLAGSLCLAVDPDLLLTVSKMTAGYRVLASPSDPDGPTRDGTGPQAARSWLDRLRALAPSICTVALPFAQVDVTALAGVHDGDLTARALTAPADIVDSLLSVKSVRGVNLPAGGTLGPDATATLTDRGFGSVVLAQNAVTEGEDVSAATGSAHGDATVRNTATVEAEAHPDVPEVVRLPGTAKPDAAPAPDSGLKVATFDMWSATALAAVGSNPPTPAFTPDRVRYAVTNDSRTARLQDALGALSWPSLNTTGSRPRSTLLMPPQQWGADRDEAGALLGQLELLYRSGLATPRSFTDLVAQPADPRPFTLSYSGDAVAQAVPDQFIQPVGQQEHRIDDLMSALVEIPQQEPTPRTFLTPLRDDLIRTLSLSDRTGTDAQADTAAQRRLEQTTRTMDGLFASVTVLPPGGVYTLASEQSPLLLVARNDLPVTIRIRFKIGAPAETNITDIGEQQLPAEGTRSFQIPTKVSDSRNLVIPISLSTPDGVPLGNATSVSVRSNAYGQALAIITACAGALLFLLAGRRLWRRFRGQPDPADKGLDPGKRRRLNGYLRARKRAQEKEKEEAQ
ncbi:hypothetical protein NONO_c76310 [Nocardia nova SH22a]|uniref:Glycoprotein n=1 Tax=Nocardia nova SH22a TaxID=1415166 RepID=W5TYN8_9NOCA|nr:DUF6049 family protein [Nocardia nova]AHH22386.1 hypothetical protein NONO_c76310 [Nocardia nova SH22a]